MSETAIAGTSSSGHTLRSIGAVSAGIVVNVFLTILTDLVLHKTGVFPPVGQPMINADGVLLLALSYRVVYGVAGSYITARLSPDRPMLHALVGGFIGLVVCIVGAAVTWNGGPAFGPHWYPLALMATAVPCAWLGGKLRLRELRQHPGTTSNSSF